MTAFIGFLIVSAVAVAIALPLLRPGPWLQEVVETAGVRERLRREKSVALIAIKEAEFDPHFELVKGANVQTVLIDPGDVPGRRREGEVRGRIALLESL